MAHIYHAEEWQSPTGLWQCNDTKDLVNNSGAWWIPCRILNMEPTDFVLMLKNEYNATAFHYNKESNVLTYAWESQDDMRRYKNFINRKARKRNAIV